MDRPLHGDKVDYSWTTPGTLLVFDYYRLQVWSLLVEKDGQHWGPEASIVWSTNESVHLSYYRYKLPKCESPLGWNLPEEWT